VSSGTGLREEAWAVEILGWAMHYGPTPVEEGTRLWQHPLEQVKGNREAEACAVLEIAYCRAMLGDFSEVQREFGLSDSARDRGLRSISGWHAACFASIELLMDDPAAAERHLRAAYELGYETGDALLGASASADLRRTTPVAPLAIPGGVRPRSRERSPVGRSTSRTIMREVRVRRRASGYS
jgi:hypothetical protein